MRWIRFLVYLFCFLNCCNLDAPSSLSQMFMKSPPEGACLPKGVWRRLHFLNTMLHRERQTSSSYNCIFYAVRICFYVALFSTHSLRKLKIENRTVGDNGAINSCYNPNTVQKKQSHCCRITHNTLVTVGVKTLYWKKLFLTISLSELSLVLLKHSLTPTHF